LVSVIGITSAAFLWSPGALAFGDCDDPQPGIDQVVFCTEGLGNSEIDIPAGANAVYVVAVGGGGGGAGSESGEDGGRGGAGALIEATFTLPMDINTLLTGVAEGGDGSAGGGSAGSGSTLSFTDPVSGELSLLVVAGGGGGGGKGASAAVGGDGAHDGTLAGGAGSNGADVGGGGGSDGAGGAGGVGAANGEDGQPLVQGSGSDSERGFGGEGATNGGDGGFGSGGGGGGGNASATTGGGGGAGGSYVNAAYLIPGTQNYRPANDEDGDFGLGGAGGIAVGQDGEAGVVLLIFRIRLVPSSNAAPELAPAPANLSFILPSTISCNFDAVEASMGAWVQLPAANDCTIESRSTDAAPSLLGWATNADFPIDIAQRQVDNGWGAYETFNDDGDLTGVFIPAGGYTLISNDTNLHPIWSK